MFANFPGKYLHRGQFQATTMVPELAIGKRSAGVALVLASAHRS